MTWLMTTNINNISNETLQRMKKRVNVKLIIFLIFSFWLCESQNTVFLFCTIRARRRTNITDTFHIGVFERENRPKRGRNTILWNNQQTSSQFAVKVSHVFCFLLKIFVSLDCLDSWLIVSLFFGFMYNTWAERRERICKRYSLRFTSVRQFARRIFCCTMWLMSTLVSRRLRITTTN